MRLTFQEERFTAIAEELKPLFLLNWHETALDREAIALDPDYDGYAARDLAGVLHITTARAGGELAGYFVNFVVPHPHYKATLFGLMDIFYLAKSLRNARNGIRLFMAMEKLMRARGVTELIAQSKVARDVSPVFARLGWRRTAVTFTKFLGVTNG